MKTDSWWPHRGCSKLLINMDHDTSKSRSFVSVLSITRICKWWLLNCSLVIVIQRHHSPLSANFNGLSHLSNLPFLHSVSGWSTKHVKSALYLVLERVLLLTSWEFFLSPPLPMTIYSLLCIWLLQIPFLRYNEAPWGWKVRGVLSNAISFFDAFVWVPCRRFNTDSSPPMPMTTQYSLIASVMPFTRRKNVLYSKATKLYTLQLNIQVLK